LYFPSLFNTKTKTKTKTFTYKIFSLKKV